MIDLGQGLIIEIVESGNGFRHDIYQDHMIVGAFGAPKMITNQVTLREVIISLRETDSLFGEITANIFGEDDANE